MTADLKTITDNLDLWTSALLTKSTAGRGSNGRVEAYGIKKLRELILELAICGKLVPQDPDNEPASVLLQKIAKQKASLVKEGKIKKDKPLPNIADYETSFVLPFGWAQVKLDAISEKITDGEHLSPQKTDFGMKLLTAKHVLDDGITLEDPQYVSQDDGIRFRERCAPQTGDVLICSRGTIGRCCAIEVDEEFCLMGSVILVRAFEQIVPRYLAYFLKSESGQFFIRGATKGMAVNALYLKDIKLCPVAIPPLAEQHRIVAKVDELMALCDQLEQQQTNSIEAHQTLVETLLGTLTTPVRPELVEGCISSQPFTLRQAQDERLEGNSSRRTEFDERWTRIADHFDTLFTTEQSIDQLKQTILQLAVMGRLVPQDPDDETASVLLQRIAVEKARLINEDKISKPKPLPPVAEEEKHFDIPDGWTWTRFDDLALHSVAGWSPSCESTPRQGDNWGVLKVSAVTWGKYNPHENKALPANLEPKPEFEVMPGDFLISRANTAELVARAVVVPNGAPPRLMMSDKIIRFVFTPELNHEYLKLINGSELSRAYYARVAGGTSSSMKNVSREQIRNLVVALPPLAEQHRIVAKVDELMALCDALKARLAAAQTTQVHLADAIVEQAVA